jgi:hypothetical protein
VGSGNRAAHNLDVTLDGRLEHGSTVTVRHESRTVSARVGWLGGPYHQLRCEEPLDAAAGDAIVVVDSRARTPGTVLEAGVPKHGPSNELLVRLVRLARAQAASPHGRGPGAGP